MKNTLKKQTSIPSQLICNTYLSATSFKLWVVVNYQPDNWKFSIEELFNHFSENKNEILSAQFELEIWGYLRKDSSQNLILHSTPYDDEQISGGSLEGVG